MIRAATSSQRYMTSRALQTFEHAIQDADDLLNHFDALNKHPPPPEIEVLKRASLVMALAALETYVEDRIVEATDALSSRGSEANHLVKFYKSSLENDLKNLVRATDAFINEQL